jgi:hypothetical protein
MEASRLGMSIDLPSNLVDRANLVSKSKTNANAGVRASNRCPTLESTMEWIEKQGFLPHEKEKLTKQVKNCPNGALRQFMKRAKR